MKTLVKKETGVWHARIRINPSDRITYKSMRTKDKLIAQKRIDELFQRMEREAAGIISPQKLINAASMPLRDLAKNYLRTMEAGMRYINATESRLHVLFSDLSWYLIRDINAEDFLRWRMSKTKYVPKTLNHYLSTLKSFTKWLVLHGYAIDDLIAIIPPFRIRGKVSFKYRALNDREIESLLKGKRSELYHFALLTGLRYAECAAVTWADVNLNSEYPHILLSGAKTKNGQGSAIKIHADLLDLLRTQKRESKLSECVFPKMPDNRTVKRDFESAGIVTNNERNEKASFHSLRKTFCMLMHQANVPHRLAQEAMRHSSPELTNDIYVDRGLLNVSAAIDAIPSLKQGTKQELKTENNTMNSDQEKIKGADSNVLEAINTLKEWCTRMESNHHAIAGTRT